MKPRCRLINVGAQVLRIQSERFSALRPIEGQIALETLGDIVDKSTNSVDADTNFVFALKGERVRWNDTCTGQ
jgi:hypothetical protein